MMGYKILVIDDDNLVCLSLKKVLISFGYETETCQDAKKTFFMIESYQPDIILLDIYLTVADGTEILKEVKKQYPQVQIVMITGFGDVKVAVRAMKLGAYDFLLKPIDLEQLQLILNKCTENLSLKREVLKYEILNSENSVLREHFGVSKTISKILTITERLAKSDNTTVLLEGESGVGKEVFARFIHQISQRRDKVFITINCAAIPKELAESELFGHEKGAFTGAVSRTKPGKFELANNGVILLDEIGELGLDLQVKLLRILQEKKFYRLGGEKEVSVNVRVIAATNKNLEDEIKKGTFREDLFYRLNVARITIPPLRERKEDIPLFVHRFVSEFADTFSLKNIDIDPEAMNLLVNHKWKGNIRELRNVIERAVLLLDGEKLKTHNFSFLSNKKGMDFDSSAEPNDEFLLKVPKKGITIDKVLKSLILQTLEITKGNQVKAAKVLGLSRSKLRYRMEQIGIEVTKKVE